MQEVLVVLWQKFDKVEEFRPWAFGVARNMVLRHLRAQKQDRHASHDDLVNQLADASVTMVERHTRQREALDGCLGKLPETQRQLVLTAYTKGTRIDQFAIRRGQTPMALYKLLHRIRQALLECVEQKLSEGGTCMSPEHLDLIQRRLSGTLMEEESSALQSALKQDEELRRLFLDYSNLDVAGSQSGQCGGHARSDRLPTRRASRAMALRPATVGCGCWHHRGPFQCFAGVWVWISTPSQDPASPDRGL